jgi:FHA domain
MDQSKKTMRHFYCRDVLWETFEQMANDFDCSIDYLINEAMRYYARSKNYQSAMASSGPMSQHQPAMGAGAPAGNSYGGAQPGYATAQQVPSPHVARRPGAPPPPPVGAPGAVRRPTHSQPPPRDSAGYAAQVPMGAGLASTLYLIYNNQRYPITKDQFIIGRGSKTSDLPIKDGNISRKHAAVIRRNGTYYIKDLGSTNGIDYKGMRIDNKRIDEGDVFHLCDYELRFTYRGD